MAKSYGFKIKNEDGTFGEQINFATSTDLVKTSDNTSLTEYLSTIDKELSGKGDITYYRTTLNFATAGEASGTLYLSNDQKSIYGDPVEAPSYSLMAGCIYQIHIYWVEDNIRKVYPNCQFSIENPGTDNIYYIISPVTIPLNTDIFVTFVAIK